MNSAGSDRAFAGSIPQFYERYLVPLIFEPYAIDIAARVARFSPARVLEVAAGTGVVTRRLADLLPADATIVATDLNQPMLDHAAAVGTSRPVEWRQADALQLPFADAAFDVVVCQFGVMFFPDKSKAHAEFRRVLRPGGRLIFNAWDRIEVNELADVVTQALAELFPADPPRFLARIPHGYHDISAIERDIAAGGFSNAVEFDTVSARSLGASAREPALAYCEGTPLRNEIQSRDAARLNQATDHAEQAIERRFGPGAVDAGMQARVVAVTR